MRWFLLSIICLILVSGCGSPGQKADLIITGANVITMTTEKTATSNTALAIADGKILSVGTEQQVMDLKGPETEVHQWDGATIIPGFHDSHCHLYGLGKALAEIDLNGTATAAEVALRVAEGAKNQPGSDWLQGRGWDQNDWPDKAYPTRQLIDPVTGDRPALLRRVDGHAALANTAALLAAGIDAQTPDPDGGEILRDENGEPTGLLIDNAVDIVRQIIPPVGQAEVRRRVLLAVEHCLSHGITAVTEAGVSWQRAQLYQELAANTELKLRYFGMYDDVPATLDKGLPAGPIFTDNDRVTIRGVKLYCDGALGSRGALLHSDYCDHAGHRGLAVSTEEHLREVALRAARAGFQVGTHAIGDRANTLVLDIYEDIFEQEKITDPRWRIEHAQILTQDDIPRFAQLGVVAAMQPVHCTSDMDWAEDRLCADRLAGAYPWKSLLDSGAHLSWGTDFPVEKASALDGLYSARTRTHHDGMPSGGWQAQETVSAQQALELYTVGSAYAVFMEEKLGMIAPGYYADLTVLSGDPVADPAAQLLQMEVLATIVQGEIVFQKSNH